MDVLNKGTGSTVTSDDQLISLTASHVRAELSDDATGHDWFHTERVWKMARHIAEFENANSLVTQLAALLHDIRDWKTSGKEQGSSEYAAQWLATIGAAPQLIGEVCGVINRVSYAGEAGEGAEPCLEAAVVKDADRLDAIGAIGIARTFAYGGSRGRPLHDPNVAPRRGMDKQAYRENNGTTINHFFEKLLLLSGWMQTQTARRIAERRHQFMLKFLEEFRLEWEANDSSDVVND